MIATCGFHQPVLTAVLPRLGGSLVSYVLLLQQQAGAAAGAVTCHPITVSLKAIWFVSGYVAVSMYTSMYCVACVDSASDPHLAVGMPAGVAHQLLYAGFFGDAFKVALSSNYSL